MLMTESSGKAVYSSDSSLPVLDVRRTVPASSGDLVTLYSYTVFWFSVTFTVGVVPTLNLPPANFVAMVMAEVPVPSVSPDVLTSAGSASVLK